VATAYLTGMRIGELLALRWEDVDLVAKELVTRWNNTKTDRDEVIPLPKAVIEQFQILKRHSPFVFPWHHDPRTLWVEFTRIQQAAGIHLPCREQHTHTPSCHVYGFHDFRRAYATANARRLKPEVLQRLMRHKSYQTTQKFYINPTNQMQDAVADMPIPNVLKKPKGETDGPTKERGPEPGPEPI
jgi:integrase